MTSEAVPNPTGRIVRCLGCGGLTGSRRALCPICDPEELPAPRSRWGGTAQRNQVALDELDEEIRRVRRHPAPPLPDRTVWSDEAALAAIPEFVMQVLMGLIADYYDSLLIREGRKPAAAQHEANLCHAAEIVRRWRELQGE